MITALEADGYAKPPLTLGDPSGTGTWVRLYVAPEGATAAHPHAAVVGLGGEINLVYLPGQVELVAFLAELLPLVSAALKAAEARPG